VVHDGETGGNRPVRPRVRGNDRISDDDIGAWRLMELLFPGVATRGVSSGCRFAWESLRASKSAKARIDSSCTCGVLKHELKGVKKLQGLNWKEV
jgi:hypothetical protein